MKGYVHIYCGDGKGKTTACAGLAVRAAGRGKKVVMARFLKTEDSGEVEPLRSIPGITVIPCEKTFGFYVQMTEDQKKEAALYYSRLLEKAWAMAVETGAGLLVLDEMMAALNCRLVEEDRLCRLLDTRPEDLEIVMTGREPSKALQARADYITEMRKIKHPYDGGVAAREGIEF